ncbi:MAG: A/G-specific adenine glycosylase [Phycisphaerales bacterium]|nr:A/G-specific adenine glycosylase [Phycisphaerales bacterium]
MTPQRTAALRRRLLAWFDAHRRDLPWRRTPDPWRIWVSEVMLQQTRVETVIPYYERFVTAFPTAAALATAPVEQALRLWAGLGYYSRVRNLKRAAEATVAERGGVVPDRAAKLAELPGVGPYISGAVASIAFNERVPAVDGNVLRVLSRVCAIETPINTLPGREEITGIAANLVPSKRPGDFNQSLMELGAAVCVPRNPDCATCPVRGQCAAFERGVVDELPRRVAKRKPRIVHAVAAVVRKRGKLLIARRAEGGLLGGLWRLPAVEATGKSAEGAFRREYGLDLALGPRVGEVRHLFTHVDLRLEVHEAKLVAPISGDVQARPKWSTLDSIAKHAVSTLDRRVLAIALNGDPVAE